MSLALLMIGKDEKFDQLVAACPGRNPNTFRMLEASTTSAWLPLMRPWAVSPRHDKHLPNRTGSGPTTPSARISPMI